MSTYRWDRDRVAHNDWLPSDYRAEALEAYFRPLVADLIDRYSSLCEAHQHFNTDIVAPLILEPLSFTSLINGLLNEIWDKVLIQIREHYQDGIEARFEVKQTWQLSDQCLDVADSEKLDTTLRAIDWQALSEAFTTAIQQISQGGRHKVCDNLILMLNAHSTPIRNQQPKWITGRYVANLAQFDDAYCFGLTQMYQRMVKTLSHLENQLEDLSPSPVQALLDAESARSYNQSMPREVYGKGDGIEVHSFKSKVELRITPTAIMGLVGYLMAHGHDQHMDAAQAFITANQAYL